MPGAAVNIPVPVNEKGAPVPSVTHRPSPEAGIRKPSGRLSVSCTSKAPLGPEPRFSTTNAKRTTSPPSTAPALASGAPPSTAVVSWPPWICAAQSVPGPAT